MEKIVNEKPKKIVVVDDKAGVRNVFAAAAFKAKSKGNDIEIGLARNLKEAQKQVKKFGDALYILDVDLGNGEFSAKLLENEAVKNNFILFTAENNVIELAKSLQDKDEKFKGKILNKGDGAVFKKLIVDLFGEVGDLYVMQQTREISLIHAPEQDIFLHVLNNEELLLDGYTININNRSNEIFERLKEEYAESHLDRITLLNNGDTNDMMPKTWKMDKIILEALGIISDDCEEQHSQVNELQYPVYPNYLLTFIVTLDKLLDNLATQLRHGVHKLSNVDNLVELYVKCLNRECN